MGINKPNVRFIVHYDLPKNLESYYQEIGRAGRDGLRADCLLLFSYADIRKIKYFIDQKEEPERQMANLHLNALIRFAEAVECRRIPLLGHFGEDFPAGWCGMCDNCLATEQKQIDVTIPAQMFLSCVKRTGEIFGANHVADVLLGTKNEKVVKFSHQELSTYGIGKEYSKNQWLRLARQLIQKGFIIQDGQFGSLKLTQKAYDLFRNKETVLGIMGEPVPAARKGKRRDGETSGREHDPTLYELLRKVRKELADQARVPPYVIFSDKALLEMATYFPMTPHGFLKIHGVGSVKLEKYSEIFMQAIRRYCQEHQLSEHTKKAPGLSVSPVGLEQKPRHILVGEAYNAGQTVAGIAEAYKIQHSTVLNHLSKYLLEGLPLRSDEFLTMPSLPAGQQQQVLETFDRLGAERLKPIFDALDGAVDYDDLKILRLVYLCNCHK
jgi:ATP-dependent DNA helicase RecQ